MKSVSKNVILIFCYILQLMFFGLCFFVFTSTIKLFPWYEPLIMGAFILLMFMPPVQAFISLIIWNLHISLLIHNNSNIILNINLCILSLTMCISIIDEHLFEPLAIIGAIAECLLALSFIITIIKPLVRRRE